MTWVVDVKRDGRQIKKGDRFIGEFEQSLPKGEGGYYHSDCRIEEGYWVGYRLVRAKKTPKQTPERKVVKYNGEPITFRGVNFGMSNCEIRNTLRNKSKSCDEKLFFSTGFFQCDSVHFSAKDQEITFFCGAFNGCGLPIQIVKDAIEEKYGITLSSHRRELSGDYLEDWARLISGGNEGFMVLGPAGDRIFVGGKDDQPHVTLIAGALGRGKLDGKGKLDF